MSVVSVNSANKSQSALRHASELAGFFSEQAVRNEELGELSPETLKALTDAGLPGLIVPRAVGGLGVKPLEAIEVIEALSAADGSTGWVAMAFTLSAGLSAAYAPGAGKIFGNGLPLMAGQGTAPNGRAIPVEGGFRVSGKWGYGSGIKHAEHVISGAMVMNGPAPRMDAHGMPEWRQCVVPKSQVKLEGNWDVLGLNATGSVDYSMADVFVPEDMTFVWNATAPSHEDVLYRLGVIGIASLLHTAFALGVGKRALAEIAPLSLKKGGPFGRLCDSEQFQIAYASNEASYRAARAFVFETWSNIQNKGDRGEKISPHDISLARLAVNHATMTAHDVALFAYKAGGGVALRSSPLQRCFRDMSAAVQHFVVSPPIHRETGRELLGLPPHQMK